MVAGNGVRQNANSGDLKVLGGKQFGISLPPPNAGSPLLSLNFGGTERTGQKVMFFGFSEGGGLLPCEARPFAAAGNPGCVPEVNTSWR